jgi:hypothetical protein
LVSASISLRIFGVLGDNVFSDLRVIAVVELILEPTFEFFDLLQQHLQGFAHDIRFRRINELGVLVEFRFDLLFDANL